MAGRSGRDRKPVERFTFGGFAKDEELDEFEVESSSEEESEGEAEACAAVAKAARRGAGSRRASGGGSAAPVRRVDADAMSALLAAAPALVDLLIQEDSIRCVTLVARDVLNLNIAFGGRLELGPVWEALAARIKAAKAAAAAAVAAGEEPAAEPAAVPAAAPQPEPQPPTAQGVGTRRGRRRAPAPPAPPPGPTALQVVQEAVAADPARSGWVKKTEAQWKFKLTARNIQGIEAVKGRWNAKNLSELAVRAAAHARWGDEVGLRAAQQVTEERSARARETYDARRKQERQEREEELAYRLLEEGLPVDLLEQDPGRLWELRYWVEYGGPHYSDLNTALPPIIAAHRRKERTRLLDDSLAKEGLAFFKADFRYRCFLQDGEVAGLQAVLEVARRHKARRLEEAERVLELSNRLDAAGLPWPRALLEFDAWLKTGEGDIDAAVQRCRLRADRELKLQEALTFNGLLHRADAERCRRYVAGTLEHRSGKPYTVDEVVESLLDTLVMEYSNMQTLMKRLAHERLPPMVEVPAAKAFIRGPGSVRELAAAVQQVRRMCHARAGLVDPPTRRPWLETGPGVPAAAEDA